MAPLSRTPPRRNILRLTPCENGPMHSDAEPIKALDRPTRSRAALHFARWLPTGITMVHAALTLVMAIWAWTLWLPENTFASSRMYDLFRVCWPFSERGWALVFCAPVLAGVVALVLPRRHKVLRLNLSGVLMVSHVLLALMTRGGNPAGTGWRIYAWVFVPLAIWRILAEAYVEWIRS